MESNEVDPQALGKASVNRPDVSVMVGQRFKRRLVADHYDVIIIGSGIGGLTNAALLSLLGKQVCVLEQHYTAGGFTHSYRRRGYEFDVGVHYIGEVHKPYSPLRRVFDIITERRLQWAEMDEVYDKIIFAEKEFEFKKGEANFVSALIEKFPSDELAIKAYVKLIRDISAKTARFFAGQAMPKWLAKVYNSIRPILVRKEYFLTTREVLESLTSNQELISVLTGQWGDHGQVPRDASFLIHALIAKHYLGGAAYPVGGASSIAREIIPTIQRSGGNVFTSAEVDHLLIKNNRAYGVKLSNGSELTANVIVSNAGFMNTFTRLVPEPVRKLHGCEQWVKGVRSSGSSVCLYAGFKGTAEQLGLKSTNLWIYPNGDHESNYDNFIANETGELPVVYISFPSTKDPLWNERCPGKSTVEIVSLTHMDNFLDWQGTTWNDRGEDYLAYKEKISQQLLNKLFEREPQLRDALDFYELSTPLSTQFYQLNQQGEIYGLDHTVERFKKHFLHPQTPIKNLYLTGADVMTAGVGGALMGGVMTTINIVGLRRASEVTDLIKNVYKQS